MATSTEAVSEVTPFQRRVYEHLRRIPRGTVTTYAHLAEAVGCGSARAVGQALRRNPFAPEVPCHRVIHSDLTLGGYSGSRDEAFLTRKTGLLAREGVHFKDGRLADPAQLFAF
jgi:methylated-DNA-[protein]-cysteine S-methyltransferase